MRDRALTLHDLLSEPGHTCLDPADLLEILVAFDPASADDRAALAGFLARGAASADAVVGAWSEHLRQILPLPVGAAHDRAGQVEALAVLDRAHVHLRALLAEPELAARAPWAEGCTHGLAERREAFTSALRARSDAWLDAAKVPGEVPGGAVTGVFDRAPEDPDAVFDRWGRGLLHSEDRAALARVVATSGPWQEVYRTWVRRRARQAGVVAWDPDLVPGFAHDEAGDGAHVWLSVPLPHLPFEGDVVPHLTALAHREGTLWLVPSPSGVMRRVVHYAVPSFRWGDAVVGEVETAIVVRKPSEREVRERAVSALAGAAFDESRPVPPQAVALARDLAQPSFVRELVRGAAAFRAGEEGASVDEAAAWASLALRARILLDRLAPRDEGRLLDALIDADAALAPSSDALLLLDDTTWSELTRDEPLDADTWWGARAALPSAPLAHLTRATSEEVPRPRTAARKPSAVRAEPLVLHAASHVELHPRGFVGEMLLPLVDPQRAEGRVARLRIWHDPTMGLRDSTRFLRTAGEALHDAFREARRLCGERARYPWEEHVIAVSLVDGDAGDLEIDGRSLGLAAVLAFVSCWVEGSIGPGLAASARLFGRNLAAIDHVPAKRAALAGTLGDAFTLLVHPDDAAALPGDERVLGVSSTLAALSAAGLQTSERAFPITPATIAGRRAELSRLVEAIKNQEIAVYADLGIDPWRVLAERVSWLCDSLAGDGHDEDVDRARPFAALAFIHGGDLRSAGDELEKIPEGTDDPAVALLRNVVDLSGAIDQQALPDEPDQDWREAARLSARIDALLPELPTKERRWLRGQALGTQGLALLHAGRIEEALPKLHAAWAHHHAELRHEALRSSVYLSMALREAGRPLEALKALDDGCAHLDDCRRYSVDYAESTLVFWRYEHARVLLALGDPRGARDELLAALDGASVRGWWPRLGILRALAWAEGILGEHVARDGRLTALEQLAEALSGDARGFARRILGEARGEPHAGRERY